MQVSCNQCKRKISSENINVAKDTAFCINCESLTSLSSILSSLPSKSFDSTQVLKGVKVESEGQTWSVQASHRSFMALYIVPFTLVWSGFSLSGIYGSQIINREFILEQSLVGLPFLIGSICLVTIALMSIFGRTLVSYEQGKVRVFMGIGAIGWNRKADWNSIDNIKEGDFHRTKYLALEGKQRLNFGWGISSEKRYFVCNYLKSKLNT
ncbi:hypothetical protein TW85_22035 [Marinomonas sp. S3726]|uniref:hypothetical protein n=1 Tax=Marinomonas sp. S3726 TaxID=579484 RepID=UPI0005FA3D78|nr:hypothetical protein [Marinomonas sp. S3726]KJZ09228.1 hypothetical protein TW85_22035 [Marinomonas sp. S3726]